MKIYEIGTCIHLQEGKQIDLLFVKIKFLADHSVQLLDKFEEKTETHKNSLRNHSIKSAINYKKERERNESSRYTN